MTKKIGTELPETLDIDLHKFAATTGRKLRHIFEEALVQYLEREWKKQNLNP